MGRKTTLFERRVSHYLIIFARGGEGKGRNFFSMTGGGEGKNRAKGKRW